MARSAERHPSNVSEWLRQRRKAGAWSLEELGAAVGVSKVTIHNWETGRYYPKADKLTKLASALGTQLQSIWSGEAFPEQHVSEAIASARHRIARAAGIPVTSVHIHLDEPDGATEN